MNTVRLNPYGAKLLLMSRKVNLALNVLVLLQRLALGLND